MPIQILLTKLLKAASSVQHGLAFVQRGIKENLFVVLCSTLDLAQSTKLIYKKVQSKLKHSQCQRKTG